MIALRALACAAMALISAVSSAAEPGLGVAIVTRDQAPLRAAPRDSGASLAVLWRGEALEVRGERMDYLQVWDHARERGGFVHASQVRRAGLTPAEAPELLAVLRFLRDAPARKRWGSASPPPLSRRRPRKPSAAPRAPRPWTRSARSPTASRAALLRALPEPGPRRRSFQRIWTSPPATE